MASMTSAHTISHLCSIFARHGIPEEIVTDNGTQFSSHDFRSFSRSNNIKHTTSSPLFPQSNGLAERSVQTAKCLIRFSENPYAALLAFRITPLENGYSPAQLLYSRQLRTNLPATSEQLRPRVPDLSVIVQREELQKQRQKSGFDSRHRAKELPI